MEKIVKQGIGGYVSTFHFDNETAATASQLSNVTCRVFTQVGAELVATTSILPESDGEMLIGISAAEADSCRDWCRAHFEYEFEGTPFSQHVYFHIAATEFDVPLHYESLINFEPELAGMAWSGDDHFAAQRRSAREEFYDRLSAAGYEPWRVLNRSQFNTAFAYLWLAHICRGFCKSNRMYWEQAQAYREEFERAFAKLNVIVDSGSRGNMASGSENSFGRNRIARG